MIYIYRHHVEPRVKLWVPKEESFPIPLRYIDVIRRAKNSLDVLTESRIDDLSERSLMALETCLNLGQGSCSSQYLMKKLKTDTCGLGGGWQKYKQQQGTITCGGKCGSEYQKQISDRTTSNGLSKIRSSTMRESWEASILLFRKIRSSKKSWKTRGKSWNCLWKQLCPVRQHSRNKDHQHHNWQQHKSWISYPGCLGAHNKQLMQYLLIPW